MIYTKTDRIIQNEGTFLMTQKKERHILIGTGAASLGLAAVLFVLTMLAGRLDSVWEPLFVLFLGLGCQCFLRVLLTTGWQYDHDRLFVTTSGWFQKNQLDKAILKRDPVCQWADLTAYDPEAFEVRPGERELVVQHTCTLELANELAAGLAFLPLLIALFADRPVLCLIILLVLSAGFSALAVYMAERARQFRFNVKAGRV